MNNNINPGDIRYLSFEGGGGKGAAYMGPFITFLLPSFSVFKVTNTTTKERVLNTNAIKGIAGASAGAITAALLACNVSLEGIGKMLLNTSLMASFNDTDQDDSFTYAKVPDLSTSPQVYSTNFRQRNQKLRAIMTGIQFLTPYLPSLITYPTVENILADWGLAPGFQIRRFTDDMMIQGMYDGYKRKKIPGITFKEHYQLTGLELVITSVNISRRQVFYLSFKTTPNLRIADAVRMSMSIPGFFKPVHITEEQVTKGSFTAFEKKILPGYWIDGGVINNNPIHAFDTRDNGDRLRSYQSGKLNKNLFGVRLGKEIKENITAPNGDVYEVNTRKDPSRIGEYVNTVVNTIIDNSSELQFHEASERSRVLDLTTTLSKQHELTTTNFAPDPLTLKLVVNKCLDETLAYFGIPPAQNPLKNKAMWVNYSKELQYAFRFLAA